LHEPDFYGFIPDSNFKRIVALNLLVLQSTLMLLLRAIATGEERSNNIKAAALCFVNPLRSSLLLLSLSLFRLVLTT
jgi:hypothetical protein